MRWAGQRSCGGRCCTPLGLRPPSFHIHTCQPPINVTGAERSLSPLQIPGPLHLTADINSHPTYSPNNSPKKETRRPNQTSTQKYYQEEVGPRCGQELQTTKDTPIPARPTAKGLINKQPHGHSENCHFPPSPPTKPQGFPRARTPLETAAGESGPWRGWAGGGARPGVGPRFPQ